MTAIITAFQTQLSAREITTPPLQNTQQNTTSHPPPSAPRRALVEPPKKRLAPDASLAVFKSWKRCWDDFTLVNKLDLATQQEQLAYLRQAITSDMECVLTHSLDVPQDTDAPITEVIKKIEDYIKQQDNPALRRYAFAHCRQDEGETFDRFYTRLKQLAVDADITCCAKGFEMRIIDGIINGIADEELRAELLSKKADCSVEEHVSHARSFLAARKTSSELSKPSSVNAISAYKKAKKKAALPKDKPKPDADPKKPKVKTCSHCRKTGHWEKTCYKKYPHLRKSKRRKSDSDSEDEDATSDEPEPERISSVLKVNAIPYVTVRRKATPKHSGNKSQPLPYQEASVSITHAHGKSWLCYADRVSGWTSVVEYSGNTSTKATIDLLRKQFEDVGVPKKLWISENSQLNNKEFDKFAKFWEIQLAQKHKSEQGNGENPTLRKLIAEHTKDPEDLQDLRNGLTDMRNEQAPDGKSQAEVLLGHAVREWTPVHRQQFARHWNERVRHMELQCAKTMPPVKSGYNCNAQNLPRITVGDQVRIQDNTSKKWTLGGRIVDVRPNGSYMVKLPSGRLIWRIRKYLYKIPVRTRSSSAGEP